MPGDDMNDWTPVEFMEYIDSKYKDGKSRKIGRLDIGWGKWSREMNLVLRTKIEVPNHQDEMPTRYKYVFAYWTNRSQLLELHHSKMRYVGSRKKKVLAKEGAKIKYAASDDPQPAQLAEFMKIVKQRSGVKDG